ncbi:pentapeptide repeat-containing protein [Nodosilinea sp. PGN35]|uniref:pentapeptide repeat-containing protein n=1 Tax=Nodosilinea sp. PGN35 TaxID=3020489 RepID=UPI0023B2524F|nr:pentapeptide repeat-containing protein [Nodosilinea sp. TSF1-S3]MDF0369010.1 pentapeptide repeat-containing protein [Nodosilinea sp. TSF1-S3]
MKTPSLHPPRFRHRSFRGQRLVGADFSGQDLRGADFTGASLIGANFSHCQAGLGLSQLVGLAMAVVLMAVLAGFITGYATSVLGVFKTSGQALGDYALLSGLLSAGILAVFLGFALGRGLAFAGAIAVTLAALTAMTAAIASAQVATLAIVQSFAIAGAVAGVLYGAVGFAAAIALSGLRFLIAVVAVAGVAALVGILFGVDAAGADLWLACAIAAVLSLILLALALQAGWRAWQGELRYALLRQIAIALTAQGTCFRGADLTDANFANALLRNVDLREARLIRTNWGQVQQLKRSRLEGTYLAHPQLQRLVITKDGHDQSFERQDLRGLNLEGANLADANLMGVDLGDSTLVGADLSRANLVQAQLQRTSLAQACLTGAYIQDWGIATSTNLEQVRCDYIFMRLPTKDDPDPCRKPDNRNEVFEAGDFSDFIAPMIKTLDLYRQQNVDPREVAQQYKTLDLYHHEGIDPAAAAIALKSLADQYPSSRLQVVALEGRGQEKIRLQARVTGDLDRSELSEEYFERYGAIKAMPYGDIQALLAGMAEKDQRIRSLETMVTSAIANNRFYVETYYNLGDTVAEKHEPQFSAGGDINYVGGDIRDVTGVVSLGAIQGEVSNTIGQLPADSAERASLKELLTQLQAAIAAEPALADDDKAEALGQVKTLAEAAQAPADGPRQKAAKTAVKILKGTAAGLPSTTKLVEEINKLLPAIVTLIGLL